MRPSWTEERVEALRLHWEAGLSCSAIANELGGVSRNAVIGKVHRLGLGGRRQSKEPRPQSTQNRRYKQKKPAPWTGVMEIEPEITPTAVTIAELERHHCRWPVAGEGHETLFCGADRFEKLPYCARHCGMSCRKPEPRKARAA